MVDLNGKVCGDFDITSNSLLLMLSGDSESFDPSNILWRNAFTEAGGVGDYRLFEDLGEDEVNYMAMYKEGEA